MGSSLDTMLLESQGKALKTGILNQQKCNEQSRFKYKVGLKATFYQ